MPWFQSLYREQMRITDGRVAMPEGNGLGFTFDRDAVESLRIK